MGKLKLKRKDLKKIGYSTGSVITLAMQLMGRHYKGADKSAVMDLLTEIKEYPEAYTDHAQLQELAEALIEDREHRKEWALRPRPLPYPVYGE